MKAQQHLSLSVVNGGLFIAQPLLRNDAVSFDTGMAYFKSRPLVDFIESPGSLPIHGSICSFPPKSTTAQL